MDVLNFLLLLLLKMTGDVENAPLTEQTATFWLRDEHQSCSFAHIQDLALHVCKIVNRSMEGSPEQVQDCVRQAYASALSI